MGLLEKAEQQYNEMEEARQRREVEAHNARASRAVSYFKNTWSVDTNIEDWHPSPRVPDDDFSDTWLEAAIDGQLIRWSRKETSGSAKTKVYLVGSWRTFHSLADLYNLLKQASPNKYEPAVNETDIERARRELIGTEAQLSGKIPGRPKHRRSLMEWLRG